jgi:hypothetical protein
MTMSEPTAAGNADGDADNGNRLDTPEALVHRHSRHLDAVLPDADPGIADAVAALARDIAETVEETPYASARRASAIAAAALYVAGRVRSDATVSQRRVSEIAGTSKNSVQANYPEVAALYLREADGDALDDSAESALRDLADGAEDVDVDTEVDDGDD